MAVEDELRKLFDEGRITAVEYDRLVSLKSLPASTGAPPSVPPPSVPPPSVPPPSVPPPSVPPPSVPPPAVPPPAVPSAPVNVRLPEPPPPPPTSARAPEPEEPALLAIARQIQSERAAAPPVRPGRTGKFKAFFIGIAVTIGAILVGLVILGLSVQAWGLSMGNILAQGTVVHLKLSNSAATGGDVVLWVQQGDTEEMCPHVITIAAEAKADVSFDCPAMQSAYFEVGVMWAEYSDLADSAKRISTPQ